MDEIEANKYYISIGTESEADIDVRVRYRLPIVCQPCAWSLTISIQPSSAPTGCLQGVLNHGYTALEVEWFAPS